MFGDIGTSPLYTVNACFSEFQQDATRYFDLHHSADDTLDKVDPKELAQNVAVWTAFVYTVADSDIDFLVDFPPGYDLFSQRIPLTECLSALLHRPVDLIPEHELNRHIRDAVLREAVEL